MVRLAPWRRESITSDAALMVSAILFCVLRARRFSNYRPGTAYARRRLRSVSRLRAYVGLGWPVIELSAYLVDM
jgi:hypothetical protein